MTGDDDERLLRNPYTPAQLRLIGECLKTPVEVFHKSLRHGARAYLVSSSKSNSAQLRKSLRSVSEKARALERALEDPALLWEVPSFFDDPALGQIADFCEARAQSIPKSGPIPKRGRQEFLLLLAGLFEKCTGKAPTRSINSITHKSQSQFFEFAALCIEPLRKGDLSGLDSAIKHVLRTRQKK